MFKNYLEDKIFANILEKHWKDVYISNKIHNILLSENVSKAECKNILEYVWNNYPDKIVD
ncbi:hypothetical protein [Coprococcus comes]|uniref:hypothetical protein n=1 Tax=Coprococcus comes TaxID=410072 RepID=UPI0018983651|nr:hypothetical protein [Coprococcus comes]